MRHILAVERHWGRDPGWLAAMDRRTQAIILADYQLLETERVERETEAEERMLAAMRR